MDIFLNISTLDATTSLSTTMNWSPALRTLIVASSLAITLVGVLGNFLVWYGSVFHAAIKMEPIAQTLITNLALSDILMTLSIFLPLAVTVAANSWVLGPGLCVIQGLTAQVAMTMEIGLMMSINCYRLWAVKKTKGDRDRIKMWQVYVYLVVLLLFSSSYIALYYTLGDKKIEFSPREGECIMERDHRQRSVLMVYLLPPLVISFTASKVLKCILWRTAKRAGTENARTQRALSLVCWAMLFSYIPTYVIIALELASVVVPDWVYMAGLYFITVNVIVNPAIYFRFNSTFNTFVMRLFKCNVPNIMRPINDTN